MSQQIQITGGAKVRDLQDVIIGSSGVLSSLGFNVANGVPQLDSNGKILVSQLPNSVMEYKGTWNVVTNTPYLVNGVGNQGDVYLVEGAATTGTSHDFGAGAITFYNGDQAIYSGSIWQRASGATGSVTSVGLSTNGGAITISNSPITTSGTIAFNFNGTSGQYVNGAGNLVTFPTTIAQAQRLITEVYNETGSTLTKGTVVYINGGHGNLPTVTKAIATGDATSAQTYGVVQNDITDNNNGYVVVLGSLGDLDTQAYPNGTQLYLSSTTAGAWTSTKQYAPAHLVYVGIVVRSHPTQGVVEIRIQNGFELDELHNVSAQTPSNNDGIFYNSTTSLWESKSIAAALGYTPANDASVVHLTGNETIGGTKTFSDATKNNGGILLQNGSSSTLAGYMNLGGLTNGVKFTSGGGISNTFILPSATGYTFTFPNATGTVALTSDLTGGTVTSVALSAPTGFSVTGSPVTTSGTLALAFAAGYSLPTTIKQSNWDDAYTWVAAFPTQTGNSGKFLTTDGSVLSWAANPLGTVTSVGLSSSTSGVTIGSSPITTSGTITIAIATASGSQNGLLSSTDWTTFNNKQNAITDPITGTGTYLYVPRFQSGGTSIGNSNIYDTLFQTLIGTTTISTFMTPRLGVYSGNYTKLEVRADTEPSLVLSTNASGTTPYTEIFNSYGNFAIKQNNPSGSTYPLYYEGTSNYLFMQTNGTQAIRIFSDQNVLLGSGTTNAGYKLDVNGTARIASAFTVSNGDSKFYSAGTSLWWGANGGTDYGQLNWNTGEAIIAATTGNQLTFRTGGVTSAQNRLVISSTGAATFSSSVTAGGNIAAIATGTTNAYLTASGSTGSYSGIVSLQRGGTEDGVLYTASTNYSPVTGASAADIVLYAAGGGRSLRFATSSSSVALTIASTGAATFSSSVTANGKLQVEYPSNGNIAYFRRSGGSYNFALAITGSEVTNTIGFDADWGTATKPDMIWSMGTSEKMRLTSSGNLGLGVTPSAWLAGYRVIEMPQMSLFSGGGGGGFLFANAYLNTSGTFTYQNSGLAAAAYNNQGGGHQWSIAPSGTAGNAITFTQAMTLTSGGNVGIGTSSPSTITSGARVLQVDGSSYGFVLASSGSVVAQMIGDAGGAVAFGSRSNHDVKLTTNDVERMRITSGGAVCIGVTTAYGSNLLNVNGGIYATSSIAAVIASDIDMHVFQNTGATYTKAAMVASIAATGGTGSYFFYGQQSTSTVALKIFSNGNIQNTNNSYGAISDARLKENITDATPKLDDLMKVKVRNYNLKGESSKQLGVISQELEQIFPNMIEESTNMGENMKIKGVKYSVFVPILIKALQEQQIQINELKQLINK